MDQDHRTRFGPGDYLGTSNPLSPSPSPEPARLHGDEEYAEDAVSLSGSARHSSGPEENVFDVPSPHSSPRTSSGSGEDFCAFEDTFATLKRRSSPPTPLKQRSPFRNPSSVRAMQNDVTPPQSPSSIQHQKLHTPSRQGTPHSVRSRHSARRTPSKLSPGKKLKKEFPLVLLHVTLLPLPSQYSTGVLEATLPPPILENWKKIQEKVTETVVERGVLIPHPREDYDLLEERLLEALELRQPRILKCGHFRLSPEEEADISDNDVDAEELDAEDVDRCDDCGRQIRDGRFGDAGTGSRRWDIKIFAANGLMRAGAWGAAWREMERVDVEILPWMEENTKRELELRREEEVRQRDERNLREDDDGVGSLDDERLREIYGQNPQEHFDGFTEDTDSADRRAAPHRRQSTPASGGHAKVPLWDLSKKFVIVAAQDRKNLAILFLSMIALLLALRGPGSVSSDSRRPLASVSSVPTINIPPAVAHVGTDPASSTISSSIAVTDSALSKSAGSAVVPPEVSSSEPKTDTADDDPQMSTDESELQEILVD
ncbi:uncharacterized protein KY384_006566 [Bacidia gigantensis]|uniref:uncharacterized protein n=1 Tax=Bacidia gigantensis TaxID=2732470 RepID=UPI001D044FCB|nr:uncharacterized protein KY384_006566 [Bacidia gigantensis]KAG8528877.1 hypothetical protein KY384_006566 [Bacidia gigantensis]